MWISVDKSPKRGWPIKAQGHTDMPEDRRLMWICVIVAVTCIAVLYVLLHFPRWIGIIP